MTTALYYQNVRGMRTKSCQFFENVLSNEYDVLCITETWLNQNFNSADYFSPEYEVYRADRNYDLLSTQYGGGALIAVKKVLPAVRRRDLEIYFESVWVEMRTQDHIKLLVGLFYYPPKYDSCSFREQLSDLGNVLNDQNCRIIVVGDFNLPAIQWNFLGGACHNSDSKEAAMYEFVSLLNLTQHNSIVNPAGHILDLVLSNFAFSECLSQAEPLVPPDIWHPPLALSYSFSSIRGKHVVTEKFLFSKGDFSGLFSFLRDHDWSNVLTNSNVNEAVDILTSVIHESFELFIPKQRCFRSSYPPWFSRELKYLLRQKLRFHRKYKKLRSVYWYQKFCDSRLLVKRVYERDHQLYLQFVEHNLSRDPKLFWQHVKDKIAQPRRNISLSKEGIVINDPKDVADYFADYFHSVCRANDAPLALSCSSIPSSNETCNMLHLFCFSEHDIKEAISSLKAKFSLAFDGIPSFIVKGCSPIFVPLLTHIFNTSLEKGIFPALWKCGVLAPVYKSGDECDVSKYRPVCLLSLFAKVFEIALIKHLSIFFKRQITDAQHGFLKGRSVETNLTTFVEYTSPIIASRGQVDVVYFDLSKAFDLVDHNLLTHKLLRYGVCNQLSMFIRDYLNSRPNFVRVAGIMSEPFISKTGVPQGSILGPLLFNVFINDLFLSVDSQILLYADDIKLFRKIVTRDDCTLLSLTFVM